MGQECLVLYLAAVFLLSVGVPAAVVFMSAAPVLVGLPLIWIFGYMGLFAALVVISLVGRPVKPLPALVPPSHLRARSISDGNRFGDNYH